MKWPSIDLASFSQIRETKLRLASAFTGEHGLKVWILFNISSWSCSHRAVLLKQMALLSCSLKNFSDKMNFSEWLGHILPCDLHFSRDLPHIPVCYASPLSRQYFLLFSDVPSIHTKSLSSPLCCLDERKCPWIWPSLPLTLHHILEKIIIYQSLHPRSTSHPVSLIVWLVKSLHHSDTQFPHVK